MGGNGELTAQRQADGRVAAEVPGARHDPLELLETQCRLGAVHLRLGQAHVRQQPVRVETELMDQLHQIADIVDRNRGAVAGEAGEIRDLYAHIHQNTPVRGFVRK